MEEHCPLAGLPWLVSLLHDRSETAVAHTSVLWNCLPAPSTVLSARVKNAVYVYT